MVIETVRCGPALGLSTHVFRTKKKPTHTTSLSADQVVDLKFHNFVFGIFENVEREKKYLKGQTNEKYMGSKLEN